MNKSELIKKLCDIEVVKYGTFTLKSGLTSSVYIDLRQIISYPKILQTVAEMTWQQVAHRPAELICGVPYTALPIATCISIAHDIPMLMRRKEPKAHGTKKMIEGVYRAGQTCVIIEDVVTTAGSVVETINDLKAEGLIVSHVAAFLDREQGGRETLKQHGCELFSVFTLKELTA